MSVPDCPVCGAPVLLVVTRGPDTHECRPCGCSVGLETARDFFER
ncbi:MULTISPECIES: formate dehydrogenase accessory protein FdhE [Haladaptatus]|nr:MULTISPECIES: formate dehydrogenase accessory protein FdhE [Haladaptatus]